MRTRSKRPRQGVSATWNLSKATNSGENGDFLAWSQLLECLCPAAFPSLTRCRSRPARLSTSWSHAINGCLGCFFFLVLLGFRSALVTCCFAAVAFSCGLRLGGVLVRFTVLLICCRSRSSGLLRYDPTSVHPLHTDRISALLL